MTFSVTVVGSGTVHPSADRTQSCFAVETGTQTIVFDLGYGAMRGMLRSGLDPSGVDRVFFTHFHPDHTSDIVPLLFTTNYGLDVPRAKPLQMTGPEPFRSFWDAVMSSWGEWISPSNYDFAVDELPLTCEGPLPLSGASLTWARAKHRPESIAYRMDGPGAHGGSFVYTGDTEYCESVVELARGADTLLIECSATDENPIPGHLTPSGAAGIASEAGVRRVILTHVFPETAKRDLISEVGSGFGGEVVVATDGMKFEV